ncbi:hypothetical protein C8Q76DRAFT_720070 [Earliella scabrosa]|nr:hypothetical protein C8Q76DRAFT_720070 [Earliella scabrosa]
MSDAMNVDPAVPPAPAAAEGAAHPQVPAEASPSPDPEVLALLASTQNECLAELGYRPTLLQEFRDLEKTCAMLTADNQKLYADNRSLALFIQQQDQRLSLLQTPTDQQKIHIAQMHEQLRMLATERDEISGRLHHALNEIVVLRQELSRFVPEAIIVSPRERVPSGSVPRPPVPIQNVQRRAVSHPTIRTHTQPITPTNVSMSAAMEGQPPQQYPGRPTHYAPQHRASLPMLLPAVSSAVPSISQHRRPSAPTPLMIPQVGQSPVSASPLNTFSGLTLANSQPATPVSSRPGTAGAPVQSHLRSASSSRPTSSKGLHTAPVPQNNFSSSSLAGAIIDLTNDDKAEEVARKRRKLEHTSHVSAPPPPTGAPAASPIASSPATMNGHISHGPPPVARPFTVPLANSSHLSHLQHTSAPPPQVSPSQHTSSSQAADQSRSSQNAQVPPVPPQSVPASQNAHNSHHGPQQPPQAVTHQPQPDLTSRAAAPPQIPPIPSWMAQTNPILARGLTEFARLQHARSQALGQSGTPSTAAPPAVAAPQPSQPTAVASLTHSKSPPVPAPQPSLSNGTAAASVPSVATPAASAPQPSPQNDMASNSAQVPSVPPNSVHGHPVQPVPTQSQPMDAVMADAQMEPEITLEAECIEVNFLEDAEDEKKLWCAMCRSRFEAGQTTEPPTPFVGALQQQLIEHCEIVHPCGWEILKDAIAKDRAKEAQA